MANTDLQLINNVVDYSANITALIESEELDFTTHPLDEKVISLIRDFQSLDEHNEFAIFKKVDNIKILWRLLIEKSIVCLRFYDTREPFIDTRAKTPHAYGVEELADYFDKYTEFESLLYGGSRFYRDHVVHVFRVWLLGIQLLLENDCNYLKRIKIADDCEVNCLEKLSVWTMMALTHDLGYPLQKALAIIEKTQGMMKSFIVNPILSIDLSFNGVQNSMNDFVLRFIGSKMHRTDIENVFVARLQPKYYFKLQKSLEHNAHGVLSALIIYKMLTFFLESDFSINEDYKFNDKDVRQFYIRREILRAIASHTCHDIYQLNIFSFSFLLILCDDAQEWGRKSIADLYIEKVDTYKFDGIQNIFNDAGNNTCTLKDKYVVEKTASIDDILRRFEKQSKTYRDVFRDGQETNNRNFNFVRQIEIDVTKLSPNKNYILKLLVQKDEQTKIVAKRTNDDVLSEKEEFFKALKLTFGEVKFSEDHKEAVIVL